MKTIEIKSIKISIPVAATELPTDVIPPDGQKVEPVQLSFKCGDIVLTGTFNGKTYKKNMKNAVPGALAIIQGTLSQNNEILSGGITIQPPKEPQPEG